MSQFDEYLSRIRDAEDRPLLKEAIKNANAAAHRSAYIMTWLSCAESIKRRFKVAALRDGAAVKIVGEYEQKERDAKSIDLFILDKAKDYGFVTGAIICASSRSMKSAACLVTHMKQPCLRPKFST